MFRRMVALAGIVALVATLALSHVGYASGYSWISGSAVTGAYTWYGPAYGSPQRFVTNSASPGPEIAFYKNSGPSGLQLGAYRCGQQGTFPWGRYPQTTGQWKPVADGVPDGTCFYLFTLSSSGSGTFNGWLDWD